MKNKFTKTKIFTLIMALFLLALVACSNSTTSPSSSATSSPQSETTPPPSSSSISSSTPSSAISSSSTSSSEASISSNSQSEVSQQQSSVSTQEESSTSSKTPELAGYVKDNQYNLYSKIVSCSIENDVMIVLFSAYADNPVNVDVSMDVWMSSDNGAGDVYETYSIDKLKEYNISMSSFWFEQTGTYKGMSYEVNVTIATTRHTFYFRDGKMSF